MNRADFIRRCYLLMMTSTGCLIPRRRLAHIPPGLRLAHEYCYFLHDECARMLVEYESAQAHWIQVEFRNAAEADRFAALTEDDSLTALRHAGYHEEARRVVLNTITMAMVSDCLHHLFEALNCLEKRKSIVALNLLRKPLLDSLVYLSWMLGDEDGFYTAFTSGDPKVLTPSMLGNRRKEIIAQALAHTRIGTRIDADLICDALFDTENEAGLYGLFQHAVHLITVKRVELRTTPENFNFIFKDPFDDDIYEGIYEHLPDLLLYLSHVVLELYDRIKPMEEGAKTAFVIRSLFGSDLVRGGAHAATVRETLEETLAPHLRCDDCGTKLVVTAHNACRLVLTDSYRCTRCRRAQGLPFSWLF